MSAFIVSKTHIDALVMGGLVAGQHQRSALRWYAGEFPDYPGFERDNDYRQAVQGITRELRHDTADRVGAMLWNENKASVDHRYNEANDREVYVFPIVSTKQRKPVEILKAIACYEYQSCEHPEWAKSEAKAFCDALRLAMVHMLPGYEEAAWEIVK